MKTNHTLFKNISSWKNFKNEVDNFSKKEKGNAERTRKPDGGHGGKLQETKSVAIVCRDLSTANGSKYVPTNSPSSSNTIT